MAAQAAPTNPTVFAQRSLVHAKMGKADRAGADRATVLRLDKDFPIDAGPVLPDPAPPAQRKKLTPAQADELAGILKDVEAAVLAKRLVPARTGIDAALSIDPTSAKAHSLRARVLAREGQWAPATAAAEEALRLDPADAWAYAMRAEAKAARKDLAGAIADSTIALTLDPTNASFWNNRGNDYYLRGQVHQARADVVEALRLRPDFAEALATRGACHLSFGEYPQALAIYEKAAAVEPANGRWPHLCASIRERLDDLEGARRDREKAAQIDKKWADAKPMTLPPVLPPAKTDPDGGGPRPR